MNFFEELKTIALERDEEKLTSLLSRHQEEYSLDTPQPYIFDGPYPPAMPMTVGGLLASEGHRDAAEFLRAHGADVNEIAFGAAAGGQREYAEWLRERHGANVNNIAFGAAWGGQRDYAEWLRVHQSADLNLIVRGAKHKGVRENLKWLREHERTEIGRIERCAALGHHYSYIKHLISLYSEKIESLIHRGVPISDHFSFICNLMLEHPFGAHLFDLPSIGAKFTELQRQQIQQLKEEMQKYDLNIQQAWAWVHHRQQLFTMIVDHYFNRIDIHAENQSLRLNQLPDDAWISIVAHLTKLNLEDTQVLVHKVKNQIVLEQQQQEQEATVANSAPSMRL